jgi:hypothetical protein
MKIRDLVVLVYGAFGGAIEGKCNRQFKTGHEKTRDNP